MVQEEERKAQEELFLGPRQRVKVQDGTEKKEEDKASEEDEDEEEGDGEGEESKRGRRKKLGDFTLAEVRRFIRSIRKFAQPLQRFKGFCCECLLVDWRPSPRTRSWKTTARRN